MMRLGRIPVHLERTAQETRRIIESALLQANDTQSDQGIEMAAVCLEHDCIELLGLEQAALAMQGNRPLKRLCRMDGSGGNGGERSLSHRIDSASVLSIRDP